MVSVECESFSKRLSCRIVEALESLNDLGEYNVDLTLAVIGEDDDNNKKAILNQNFYSGYYLLYKE